MNSIKKHSERSQACKDLGRKPVGVVFVIQNGVKIDRSSK